MRNDGIWFLPEDEPLDLSQYCYLSAPDALVIAASDSQLQLVEYLLEKGADLGLQNERGQTALMAVVEVGLLISEQI